MTPTFRIIEPKLPTVRDATAVADKARKYWDYFCIPTLVDNLPALLEHTKTNYANVKDFARKGRTNCKDHFRYAELACEDKAHFHAIERRADELRYPMRYPDDDLRYAEIKALCKRGLKLKV